MFIDYLGTYYEWLRAGHIIFVIAWMAGLLYLPRLYVYHADVNASSKMITTFKVMERRLLRGIMNPAMMGAWLFGGLMLWVKWDFLMDQGWFHLKLLCIIILTLLHMVFSKWRRVFAQDLNERSPRFYKIWNEVPAVLMIIIVISAVVEPF